jgi:hypothetical protein
MVCPFVLLPFPCVLTQNMVNYFFPFYTHTHAQHYKDITEEQDSQNTHNPTYFGVRPTVHPPERLAFPVLTVNNTTIREVVPCQLRKPRY